MNFIDKVRVYLAAGDGGGRVPVVPAPEVPGVRRPNGGDGGNGGAVWFEAAARLTP